MSSLLPSTKAGEPVKCNGCGHEFPQDPCYEVDCPDCGAKAGHYCKRPSEHSGRFTPFHASRDLKALEMGFYDHNGTNKCGPNSGSKRANEILYPAKQGQLFDPL